MSKPLKIKKESLSAPLLRRLSSFIIDLLIINLFLAAPFRKFFAKNIPTGSISENIVYLQQNPMAINSMYLALFFITIIALLYFVLMEFKLAQTPGMMLMQIFVESDTKKLTFTQCVLRNMFIIPFFPFVLLWIIDPVYLFFSKKSQRFTEKLSSTRVVMKKQRLI